MTKKNLRSILILIEIFLLAIIIIKFSFIGIREEVVLTTNGLEIIREDLGLYYLLGLLLVGIGVIIATMNPKLEDTTSQRRLDEIIQKQNDK
ncbi:MAG: hypothetical protein Q4A78_06720 [Peptostreptococcaceae bacterium]|nr:hypothetical protein [Peptostreptococcaceae bacterium]